MEKWKVFIMIVACFLFTGCTAKEPRPPLTTPHLVVVFTHAGMPISEVMRVSLDGTILEKVIKQIFPLEKMMHFCMLSAERIKK